MKTEKSLAILFLIGLIFKLLHLQGAHLILLISLMSLAIIYFPGGFYFFSDKTIKRSNVGLSVIAGLFFSIIAIGMLFKLFKWPYSEIYLLAGMIAGGLLIPLIFFLKSKAVEELKSYYSTMLIRSLILSPAAVLFYFYPFN